MKQLTDVEKESFGWLEKLCEAHMYADRLGPIRDYLKSALDTEQTVQVNAMLVEALKDALYALQVPLVACQQGVVSKCKCRKCVVARGDSVFTAAQQAQPERAPLSDAEIESIAKPFITSVGSHWEHDDAIRDSNGDVEKFARAIEAHHGIKQGGQHD